MPTSNETWVAPRKTRETNTARTALDRFHKLRGRVYGQFRLFEFRTLDHNAESGAKSRTTVLSPCAPISNVMLSPSLNVGSN